MSRPSRPHSLKRCLMRRRAAAFAAALWACAACQAPTPPSAHEGAPPAASPEAASQEVAAEAGAARAQRDDAATRRGVAAALTARALQGRAQGRRAAAARAAAAHVIAHGVLATATAAAALRVDAEAAAEAAAAFGLTAASDHIKQAAKDGKRRHRHRASAKLTDGPKGSPRNTRQVAEGYWLGGEPKTAAEVEALHRAGVRAILSAVSTRKEVNEAIDRLGIAHISVLFGSKFPDAGKVLRALKPFDADEIFVHCEYGGDRSGVMIAFLLTVRDGWRPDHALLAMTFHQARDVQGLIAVLGKHGVTVTDDALRRYLSIYAGRFGGLKVRNQAYQGLVSSTLTAMSAHGVALSGATSRLDTAEDKATP